MSEKAIVNRNVMRSSVRNRDLVTATIQGIAPTRIIKIQQLLTCNVGAERGRVMGLTSLIRNVGGSKTNQSTPRAAHPSCPLNIVLQRSNQSVDIDNQLVHGPAILRFPDAVHKIIAYGRRPPLC